jgi:hypothetical protein
MLNNIELEQRKLKAYDDKELVNMLLTYKENRHNDKHTALVKELKLRGVEI